MGRPHVAVEAGRAAGTILGGDTPVSAQGGGDERLAIDRQGDGLPGPRIVERRPIDAQRQEHHREAGTRSTAHVRARLQLLEALERHVVGEVRLAVPGRGPPARVRPAPSRTAPLGEGRRGPAVVRVAREDEHSRPGVQDCRR